MGKWLPSRNMAVRLALYFFVANGIILLFVTLAGSALTGSLIKKNTMYYAQDYIRSMNNELDFYMQDIDYLTISQFFDQDLTARLADNVSRYEMRASFDTFMTGRDFISDVFVVNNYLQVAGTSSIDHEKLLQSDIFQRIKASDGELVVSPVGTPDFILNTARSGEEVLFVGRKVKNMQRNQVEGEVIVTVRADRIAKIVEKDVQKYDERILILDRNLRLVYSSDSGAAPFAEKLGSLDAQAASRSADDGHLYIRAGGDRDAPLTIAAVIPEKALLKDVSAIRSTLALISFVMLVVSIGFGFLLSYRFLRPIVRLSLFMRTVSNEALVPYRTKKEWKDEVGFLVASFNRMIRRLQDSLDHIELERERQRKAELRALQSQINPHFIYNTLNHVRWLARMGRSEPVFDMITSMNEILVGAFRLDQPIVTIWEETGYLKQYVHIQSLVHGGKFEVEYDIDEAVYDRPIAKLTIQPIVENAIFHGMLPKNGPGRIRVAAKETDHEVVVTVSDDGVGTDDVDLHGPSGARERVGLTNVDKRIKLFFGERYGLSMRSAKGEGTVVTLRLPKSFPGTGGPDKQAD
ncbi:cache domain-containing sensor histidine kinase [Paenibacillus flagellatus]|uniref:HAMP domain-containing protein n=1 Tax=Paenibacillus flagellatus TaxID=2211139 RepID=A0A2V5KCK5_9BACL|nr:histidine kinase [Paenibacillus flagellatus]PYI57345.1 hypothetical protein DLM86_02595 [Paenibacillus flagellatus]